MRLRQPHQGNRVWPNLMSARTLVVSLAGFCLLGGCIKEISNEERLDRETRKTDAFKSATAEELLKMKCDDLMAELAKAREENTSEEARVAAYMDLTDRLQARTVRFEASLSRNPDLAYQEGSENIVAARDSCTQADADARFDFEALVREIIKVPVVDEYRDNKSLKAARLNFEALRAAVAKLNLDDEDALLARIANAEKAVEAPKEGKRKK